MQPRNSQVRGCMVVGRIIREVFEHKRGHDIDHQPVRRIGHKAWASYHDDHPDQDPAALIVGRHLGLPSHTFGMWVSES